MKPLRALTILAIFVAGFFSTNAQDVITLKSGEEIEAKVTEISATEIKYKRFDNLDGPTIVIEKVQVFAINYENGTREVINTVEEKAATTDENYALLHIYRNSAVGGLLNFDLHLEDKVICRVQNKWKETIKVYQEGLVTLWAKTEARKELPINIEFGKEYYIRCSITMGFAVGHPKMELMEEGIGKREFEALKEKRK